MVQDPFVIRTVQQRSHCDGATQSLFAKIAVSYPVYRAAALRRNAQRCFFAIRWVQNEMALQAATEMSKADMAAAFSGWIDQYAVNGAAGLGLCFLIAGLILWGVLKGTARKTLSFSPKAAPAPKAQPKKSSAEELQADQRRQERLYLHLLCVLQREGRLMDFFTEDLDQYEDAQIGAAVRGIHGDCRKAITKHLAPAPVIDTPEGAETTIAAGFDPQAVKLTGNVAGEPPFTGILRHAGWRAGKIELPTLTDVQDTAIIAPAEVELP